MATNSTLPDAQRPKVITDLPNEVLARICEYIVPPEVRQRPSPTASLISKAWNCVEGAKEGRSWKILHKRDDHPNYPFGLLQSLLDNENRMRVWFHVDEKRISPTTSQTSPPPANLSTTNNAGITLEGIRDATPLQVFGDSRAYVMVDTCNMRMQVAPQGSVPGNTAFSAFRQAMGNMTRLGLEIRIDLGPKGSGGTKFFLEQVASQLSTLQEQGSRLSDVTIKIVLGFWSTERDRTVRYPWMFTHLPIHQTSNTLFELVQFISGQEDKPLAEVAAQFAGSMLHKPCKDFQPSRPIQDLTSTLRDPKRLSLMQD